MGGIQNEALVKGKHVNVLIEEILPDLIVVSFDFDEKIYQGILLDSTKRPFPCGVIPPKEVELAGGEGSNKLHSVMQRYTYTDPSKNSDLDLEIGCPKVKKKPKVSRPNVRLRARQVVCSNCQSICNEKSEKVKGTTDVKAEDSYSTNRLSSSKSNIESINNKNKEGKSLRDIRKLSPINAISSSGERTKVVNNSERSASPKHSVLVPKLIKLKAKEIESATNNTLPCFSLRNKTVPKICDDQSINEEKSLVTNIPDKLPPLRLKGSNDIDKRKRSKIDKVSTKNSKDIPTSIKPAKIGNIRTRSRGSIDETINAITSRRFGKILSGTSIVVPELIKHEIFEIPTKNPLVEQTTEIQKIIPMVDKNCAEVQSINEISEPPQGSVPKLILPLNLMSDSQEKPEKMNLRKKRSIGSMEDLWDETIFDDTKKVKVVCESNTDQSSSVQVAESIQDPEKPKTTPILKISFGPGKGTILKIPAKSTLSEEKKVEEENHEVDKNVTENEGLTKAARKALKRAKKDAHRRAIGSNIKGYKGSRFGGKSPLRLGGVSPGRIPGFTVSRFGGTSPGRFGGASPGRFGGASPARFGGSSPGRFGGGSPAGSRILLSPRSGSDKVQRLQPKKHKHKVKHKKKHREDRKHKSSDENSESNDHSINNSENKNIAYNEDQIIKCETDTIKAPISPLPSDSSDVVGSSPQSQESNDALQNARHKLSISIKRVSDASYVACDASETYLNTELSENSATGSSSLLPDSQVDEKKLSVSGDIPDKPELMTIKESDILMCLNSPPMTDVAFNDSSSDSSELPNFPQFAMVNEELGEEETKLLLTLSWREVETCEVGEGRLFSIGDIVWGKCLGISWWPAKVTGLRILNDDSDQPIRQACVNWFGCSSSSFIQTDTLQPYLKMYNTLNKNNKSDPFQEAIVQASFEASLVSETSIQNAIPESSITASPREVDVAS